MSKGQFKTAVHAWGQMTPEEQAAFRVWLDSPDAEPKQLLAHMTGDDRVAAAQEEIARLESLNYRQELALKGLNASASAGVRAIIEQADADRQRYKQERDELIRAYQKPILNAVQSYPDQTYVSAILLIYTPDDPESLYSVPVPAAPYPGSAAQAQAELLMPMMHVLTRIPTPGDINHKTVPPLSLGEISLILADLYDPRKDPETFDARRREIVDTTWQKVDRDYPGEYVQSDFKDVLNKVIKRTGDEGKKRIERENASTDGIRTLLTRRLR